MRKADYRLLLFDFMLRIVDTYGCDHFQDRTISIVIFLERPMRIQSVVVGILALVSSILLSLETKAQQSEEELAEVTFTVSALSDAGTAILGKLREKGSFEYTESRMGDILTELRQDLGINIRLHSSAIDNSLDEETLITFSQNDASWQALLMAMLKPYEVTISIHNETLVILADDAFYGQLDVRLYDCSKMLNRIGDRDVVENAGKLIASLKRNIDPENWDSTGGIFSVSHFDGVLIIRQSASNHREIEQLMKRIDERSAG